MKPWLAIDSATRRATLALGPAGSAGREVAVAGRDLSGVIERVAGELLEAAGVRARDLGGVVVADGPGSFTGLRIGIAFAKGLCAAAGLPLVTAPSLLGAAWAAGRKGGTVVVEYDALRGEVFRAVYRFERGVVTTLAAPGLAPAGSAAGVAGAAGAAVAGEADASAAALLGLLALRGATTPVGDPAAWEPVYGRLAEAEARRAGRGGGHER